MTAGMLTARPVSSAYRRAASPEPGTSHHRSRSGGARPAVSQSISRKPAPRRIRLPECGSPCVRTGARPSAERLAARSRNRASAPARPAAWSDRSWRAGSENGPPRQDLPRSRDGFVEKPGSGKLQRPDRRHAGIAGAWHAARRVCRRRRSDPPGVEGFSPLSGPPGREGKQADRVVGPRPGDGLAGQRSAPAPPRSAGRARPA